MSDLKTNLIDVGDDNNPSHRPPRAKLRSSLNAKNAERFMDIFYDIYKNRRNVIVPYCKTNLSPATLHNRLGEALNYLYQVDSNIPGSKLTMAQYAELRGLVTFTKVANGIMIKFTRSLSRPDTRQRLSIADTIADTNSNVVQLLKDLELVRHSANSGATTEEEKAILLEQEDKLMTQITLASNPAATTHFELGVNSSVDGTNKNQTLQQIVQEFLLDDERADLTLVGLEQLGGFPIEGEIKKHLLDLLVSAGVEYVIGKNGDSLIVLKS